MPGTHHQACLFASPRGSGVLRLVCSKPTTALSGHIPVPSASTKPTHYSPPSSDGGLRIAKQWSYPGWPPPSTLDSLTSGGGEHDEMARRVLHTFEPARLMAIVPFLGQITRLLQVKHCASHRSNLSGRDLWKRGRLSCARRRAFGEQHDTTIPVFHRQAGTIARKLEQCGRGWWF